MFAMPTIDTSYTYIEQPKQFIQYVNRNATPTSFEAIRFDVPTGSVYETDVVSKLVSASINFIKDMAVLPIDDEMDNIIDSLVNSVHSKAKITPIKKI